MKCKICGKEINLEIFGMPEDVCWGCYNDDLKAKLLDENLKAILYNTSKDTQIKKN